MSAEDDYGATGWEYVEGILDEEDERKATVECVRDRFPFTEGNILRATKTKYGISVVFERGKNVKPGPQSPSDSTRTVYFTIPKFEFQTKLRKLRGSTENTIIDEEQGIGTKPIVSESCGEE